MIDKQLQAHYRYKRFTQTLLAMSGYWNWSTKSGKSTYYWTFCMVLAMITHTIIIVHKSYIQRHNLKNFVKCLGFATSAISTLLKMAIFLINRKSLANCYRTLNDLLEEELVRNEKIQTIIFSSLRSIYILAYTYFIMSTVLYLQYFLPPYLFMIRDLCHFHLTTNYILPLSGGYAYFWTVPDNFLYHLHLLFETIIVLLDSIIILSIDIAFGFYVYHFASTMHAMTFRLTNSLPTEKISDILRTCVTKHQTLLQCRNTLQHIYGPIVFYYIILNAVLLCALLNDMTPVLFPSIEIPQSIQHKTCNYVTTMLQQDYNLAAILLQNNCKFCAVSDISYDKAFRLATCFLEKLFQAFMYTWYGTILTSTDEDFRRGIYFSKWYNSNLDCHVRTNVILIMMQKPMIINTFFSPIDMTLFTNVVNTAMSYFILLQSIG